MNAESTRRTSQCSGNIDVRKTWKLSILHFETDLVMKELWLCIRQFGL